jgi:predicted 2-oxoglutarate/Fe(II)-dependent dioxygenase YbiX
MTASIANLLSLLKPAGAFATRLRAPAADLELEVTGLGTVKLPITARAAQQLRAAASPSAFGLREQTLHDPNVRNSWEVGPRRVKLSARWEEALRGHLVEIQDALGVPAGAVLRAELDKLLLYEQGQFFKPHQDSEKSDDMVGTLVVVLPSQYTGGALTVEHRGERSTFKRLATQAKDLSLLAFYADCHHEISPVSTGVRVALTYRLVLDARGAEVSLRDHGALVERLTGQVRAHFETPVARGYLRTPPAPPRRLIYLLDHEYTQRSLSWDHLKNGDRLRAAALQAVAQRLDCECALALAEVHEIWNCEDEGLFGRSARWGGWRGRALVGAGEDAEEEGHKITDLCDSSIELTSWVDAEGLRLEGNRIVVESHELCATRPSSDLKPYRSEYEGYQGNYGNTLERWYHRGAVALWPRSLAFALAAETSPGWAVDQLLALARTTPQRAAAVAKARSLLPQWSSSIQDLAKERSFVTKLLQLAARLDDAELALSLLAPIRADVLSSGPVRSALMALVEIHGVVWGQRLFEAWMPREALRTPPWIPALAELAQALREGPVGAALANWLVDREVAAALERLGLERRVLAEAWLDLDAFADEAAHLAHVLAAAVGIARPELVERIVQALTSASHPASLSLLLQVLRAAMARSPALREVVLGSSLHLACVERIEALLSAPPRAAGDWALRCPRICGCADCDGLWKFLASSDQGLDWPLNKDRRAHLHHVIELARLPLTHLTLHRGSPHILQLRKQPSLFTREASHREQLRSILAELRGARPASASARRPPRSPSKGRSPRTRSGSA